MIAFTVFGTPVPQGSSKAFIPKGWNRAVITSDNSKLKPWRQQISGAALCAMADLLPTDEAVIVTMRFFFARPKSLPKRVVHKTTRPDSDKCVRAIFDSLTGTVYVDDAQVVEQHVFKRFGLPERVEIEVELAPIPEHGAPIQAQEEAAQQCLPMN